jgi:hypothetical protein
MPHNPKESESDLIDHVVILFAEWWENGHPNQPKKEIIKKKKNESILELKACSRLFDHVNQPPNKGYP